MLRRLGLAALGASPWWLVPGMLALAAFAWLLTLIEVDAAGRAYAAYGGIYIAATLVWLWLVEGTRPDRWDITGAAVCLVALRPLCNSRDEHSHREAGGLAACTATEDPFEGLNAFLEKRQAAFKGR